MSTTPQLLSPTRSIHPSSPSAALSPQPQPSFKLDEPRLVIQKLVLINFKSYAGTQEIGPFNTSFTAVVGPNGSGKSNVIDSLLFVFGFRAKKMRQDKLSNLIHKSEHQQNCKFARVEVHFEMLNMENSAFVLAREVRIDGSNFYMLNNERKTYLEVSQLLITRGIDLKHKRFLILQGEVESIALMPPKAEADGDDGLLEYLEDIIGTSSYKTSLEDLNTKQEELKVDCGEKLRRCEHIQKDLKKLEALRENVEIFVVNKNKSTLTKNMLLQLKELKQQRKNDLYAKDLLDYQTKLTNEQESVNGFRKKLSEIDFEINLKNKELNKIKLELKTVSENLRQTQLQEAKAKQQRDQHGLKLKKAEKQLASAQNESQQASQWLSNYEQDTNKNEQSLTNLKVQLQNEQQVLESIQGKLHDSTKDLHLELQSLQYEAEPYRTEIANLNHKLKSTKQNITESEQKLNMLKTKEEECRKQAENTILTGKENKHKLKLKETELESLKKEQTSTSDEILQLETEFTKLDKKLYTLKQELGAAKESNVRHMDMGRIEHALTKLKIPGFYGRLGSLGSIDAKYDIAVSTAGPELNNMVVDTVETAQKCIEVLRQRKLGRARFMSLANLPQPNNEPASNFPAPRLIDLVKYKDPVLRKAFASALGNTLVVNDLKEANKVAFGGSRRFKVVTLQGGLVKVSGQMSGGGRPSKGLMSHASVSSLSNEEIDNLEREVSNLEMDYFATKQKLEELNSLKESHDVSVPRLSAEINMLEMSLTEEKEQMLNLRKQRRVLESEVAEQTQSHSNLTLESEPLIADLEHQKLDLTKRSDSIESAIKAIQDKILNAGGLQLREQKSKVDDIQLNMKDLQKRIDDDRNKLGLQQSRLKKFTQQIEDLEGEIKMLNSTTPDEEMTDNTSELSLEKEKLATQSQSLLNDIDNLKFEAGNVKKEVDKSRASIVECENEVKKYQGNLNELHSSITSLKKQRQQLSLLDEKVVKPLTEELNDTAMDVEVQDEMEDVKFPILSDLSPDELDALNEDELEVKIQQSEKACEGKSFDMDAINRYRARFEEFLERKRVSDLAINDFENVKAEFERIKNRRYSEFMEGFHEISSKLKEMYNLITMGGNAELELVDSMDPFAEGILFSVMPPKKSWRNIANLSGGEKTLSSLALVFALHHYKPTPLYVMDEIDAALDFRNVSIIANYIKERTKNGQFIVISLRNNMFELASRLVGIYKIDNMTQSATIQVNQD